MRRLATTAVLAIVLAGCGGASDTVDPNSTESEWVDFGVPSDGGTVFFEIGSASVWLGTAEVETYVRELVDLGRLKPAVLQVDPMLVISPLGRQVVSYEFGPGSRRMILLRGLDEKIARIEVDGESFARLEVRDVHKGNVGNREYRAPSGRLLFAYGLYVSD
jgi:hypothetical protein